MRWKNCGLRKMDNVCVGIRDMVGGSPPPHPPCLKCHLFASCYPPALSATDTHSY